MAHSLWRCLGPKKVSDEAEKGPGDQFSHRWDNLVGVLELGSGQLIKVLDQRCSPRHDHEHANNWACTTKPFVVSKY
jgi:hypothetical protein